MSSNKQKNITQYKDIGKIKTDFVTYLFKLKDGRLCVGVYQNKMHIIKYSKRTFLKQITIPNYTNSMAKITQLKNELIFFPNKENDINLIRVSKSSYEIVYTIKLDKKLIKQFQKYNSFIELSNNQIAVLVSDYKDDKIFLYNYNGDNYNLSTVIKCFYNKIVLSLDIVEIPKINELAYYSNKGLIFYNLKNIEITKKIGNCLGFELNNTMTLYEHDYLILGSISMSFNNDKNGFYLIKCSTHEFIDSFKCEELDFMFCTAMKILNDKTILCGFHKYGLYTSFVHIKIENEKIKLIGIRRISYEEIDSEIYGIEQFQDVLVAGNRNMILIYK